MTQPQTSTPTPAPTLTQTPASASASASATYRRDALVDLERPGRWAKQLASHLGRKLATTQTDRGAQLTMEHEEGPATCLLDTSAEARLGLHVESTSEAAAERLAQVVSSHLERFAEKEGVQVSWS